MTVVFAVNPVFGLPLIGRYLRAPSLFLALFYGLAVAGWLLLERDHPERRVWMAVGVVAALLSVVYVPWHLDRLDRLHDRYANDGPMYADIRSAGESPAVRAAVASCGAIQAADHRPVPYLRWWLDTDPGSVQILGLTGAKPRVVFLPRKTKNVRSFYGSELPDAKPPAGTRRIYRNHSWDVYALPECA
jgi:hypothetical protein